MIYALQAFGAYKASEQASALKMRDWKDATDLVIGHGGGQDNLNESNENTVLMGSHKGHAGISENGVSTTLNAQEKERPLIGSTVVRRLTPLECTRLQGFPDGWVDIGEPVEVKDKEGDVVGVDYYYTDEEGKRRKVTDSAKYKALGNAIATPFWFWLLRRISAQYERPATLGSLFSGIGGFEYVHEKCNGPGTALFASEIESYCIAVTKEHFPEGE